MLPNAVEVVSLFCDFLINSRARVCVCACFKREKKFVAAGVMGGKALFWIFFWLDVRESEEITKEAFCC